jgi:hypothetical protein
MNAKRTILIAGLAFLTVLVAGCKRSAVDEPSPFGPSTFALTFELEARPNVILSTSSRPMAEIRAVVKQNGQPVRDKLIFFTILFGPGEFADYSHRTFALTDGSGVATVIYVGPTMYEIDGDTNATIKVQPETSTPEYIHKQVDIRILKGEEL